MLMHVKTCVIPIIFHHFPKNLDRTITFNSATLKNTQTEPQRYIISFNETNDILSQWIKYKKNKIFFYFLEKYSGRICKSTITKILT